MSFIIKDLLFWIQKTLSFIGGSSNFLFRFVFKVKVYQLYSYLPVYLFKFCSPIMKIGIVVRVNITCDYITTKFTDGNFSTICYVYGSFRLRKYPPENWVSAPGNSCCTSLHVTYHKPSIQFFVHWWIHTYIEQLSVYLCLSTKPNKIHFLSGMNSKYTSHV